MIDFDDIQGNILAGFNTEFQIFVALTFAEDKSITEVARWLAERSIDITSVTEVRNERKPMKSITQRQPLTWLCLAVSERIMSMTQPDIIFGDDAFRRGMIRRASPVLGDMTPAPNWKVGGPNNFVDVLLIVASNNKMAASERADDLIKSANSVGLQVCYREIGEKIGDREHFGFRDGVSQPTIVGYDATGELEAGHFIYGYPKLPGGPPASVIMDKRGITKNGSLLVLRRLEQDVEKFRDFCFKETAKIQTEWPGLTPEHLQALIVGRWPNGAMAKYSDIADPGLVPDENDFDFSDDMNGMVCPFGAHIRKVNPRKGPRDLVDVPRFLRRGIPFGATYEKEPDANRGLIFLSFQTSITDGFELISSKWMNTTNKPAALSGHDFLIGRSPSNRNLPLKSPYGLLEIFDQGENWVLPTGGSYLFAPGKSGLARFNSKPVMTFTTKIKRNLVRIKDILATNAQ